MRIREKLRYSQLKVSQVIITFHTHDLRFQHKNADSAPLMGNPAVNRRHKQIMTKVPISKHGSQIFPPVPLSQLVRGIKC